MCGINSLKLPIAFCTASKALKRGLSGESHGHANDPFLGIKVNDPYLASLCYVYTLYKHLNSFIFCWILISFETNYERNNLWWNMLTLWNHFFLKKLNNVRGSSAKWWSAPTLIDCPPSPLLLLILLKKTKNQEKIQNNSARYPEKLMYKVVICMHQLWLISSR